VITARCQVFSRVPTTSSFQRPFRSGIRPARVRLYSGCRFTRFRLLSFFFPVLLVPCCFPFFLVCVCFQVLCRQSSPRLFTAHRPLLGLFLCPHRDELPTLIPFSILDLCAIDVCFFCFLIYFPILLPSFGCIYDFRVIFLILFYFPVLLYFPKYKKAPQTTSDLRFSPLKFQK
jgi:hypothetical protein